MAPCASSKREVGGKQEGGYFVDVVLIDHFEAECHSQDERIY